MAKFFFSWIVIREKTDYMWKINIVILASIVSLHLCKEYLTAVIFKTPFLFLIKSFFPDVFSFAVTSLCVLNWLTGRDCCCQNASCISTQSVLPIRDHDRTVRSRMTRRGCTRGWKWKALTWIADGLPATPSRRSPHWLCVAAITRINFKNWISV